MDTESQRTLVSYRGSDTESLEDHPLSAAFLEEETVQETGAEGKRANNESSKDFFSCSFEFPTVLLGKHARRGLWRNLRITHSNRRV